jgi:transmembrane sensor
MNRRSNSQTSDSGSEMGRTLLDWPRESGRDGELRERIKVHLVRKTQRRRAQSAGAALAVLALIGVFWGAPFLFDTANVSTLPAHRQMLDLVDGSQAELNAQTKLHSDFRYGRRIVKLDQGEAFFTVAKDSKHPFLVETSAGTVRVTGTKFNVRVAGDSHVEVTLIEGTVFMESLRSQPQDSGKVSTIRLQPGQQFISGQLGPRTLSSTELDGVVAWRHGELVLDGLTLAEAASRVAAFHGIKIAVAPEVADRRPGGSFHLDNLTGIFVAFQTALPVQVLHQDDGSYRIVAK